VCCADDADNQEISDKIDLLSALPENDSVAKNMTDPTSISDMPVRSLTFN